MSIPEGVSHSRGAGAPAIGSRERPLTTIPPRRFKIHKVRKLDAVTERAAGGNDGIGEAQCANVDGEVYFAGHSHRAEF